MDDTWMLWLPMGIGWSPQAVLQTERELPGPRGQHLKQTRHRKGTGREIGGKLHLWTGGGTTLFPLDVGGTILSVLLQR